MAETPLVGRVTGTADCHWADPKTEAFDRDGVPLGRKYALASGFLEITYNTGTKVILQGPCMYDVESSRGGFLSLGKLTARVEKKGSGVGGKDCRVVGRANRQPSLSHKGTDQPLRSPHAPYPANPKSEIRNPKSLIPNP